MEKTELSDRVISAADLPGRLAALDGWRGDTGGISRDYPVGWHGAVSMTVKIGPLAVELEHRPDLDIRQAGLRVFLCTCAAGGDAVTELDLAMAGRIDAIAAATAP